MKGNEKKTANRTFHTDHSGIGPYNSAEDISLPSVSKQVIVRANSSISLRSTSEETRLKNNLEQRRNKTQYRYFTSLHTTELFSSQAISSILDETEKKRENVNAKGLVVIDQETMYTSVLLNLGEGKVLLILFLCAFEL